MKGNIRRLFILLLIITLVIIIILNFPWILIYLEIQSMQDPLKPEITYGEFPFRLTYEIDGQIIVVEDTLICEYDGVGSDEGRGKFRRWRSYLASGKSEIVLLEVQNPVADWGGKPLIQIIYYNPGAAGYYMGDMGEGVVYTHSFPNATNYREYEGGSKGRGIIDAEELYDKFKIKLLEWEYTQPIENTFK